MPQTRWLLVSTGLASLFLFAQCTSGSESNDGSGGKILNMGSGGDSGSGGQGGQTGSGGQGGQTGSGGKGGQAGSGGIQGSGGKGGQAGSGGIPGGSGGAPGSGGAAQVDCMGQGLAKPGDQTSTSRAYLNLGDMRLINNRWGSDERNCTGTQQSVYVNSDRTLGWSFNRPGCGGDKAKPDYPEIEFGVAPFGATSSLLTTPACSSTKLLPIQIKSLTSANITLNNFNVTFTKPSIWNIDFEVWLSQKNPLTDANPGVFAEIITFWGWENGRWACDKSGNLTSAGVGYHLCHQSDNWANGWRFYNFNVDGGPFQTVNGKVDVKAFIDWVVSRYSLSTELWLTRIEVGTEIDDNTIGTAKLNGISFEVNGTTKSAQFAN